MPSSLFLQRMSGPEKIAGLAAYGAAPLSSAADEAALRVEDGIPDPLPI
jgi:hypothetical protein